MCFSWGSNQFGQLGLGDTEIRPKPHRVYENIENQFVAKVSCGGNHSFFLLQSGDLYSCGNAS